jgi:hypothetical protein
LALKLCEQGLRKFTEKAIKAFVFTAQRRRPPSTGTTITTGDETTWGDGSDDSHAEITDLPVKEEGAQATLTAGLGEPP